MVHIVQASGVSRPAALCRGVVGCHWPPPSRLFLVTPAHPRDIDLKELSTTPSSRTTTKPARSNYFPIAPPLEIMTMIEPRKLRRTKQSELRREPRLTPMARLKRQCQSQPRRPYETFTIAVASLFLMMFPLLATVSSTTPEAALVESYGGCYDLTGASCTCTEVDLGSQSLTRTLPAELSACTGITYL